MTNSGAFREAARRFCVEPVDLDVPYERFDAATRMEINRIAEAMQLAAEATYEAYRRGIGLNPHPLKPLGPKFGPEVEALILSRLGKESKS